MLLWHQTEKQGEYVVEAENVDQQDLIVNSGGYIFNPSETGFSTPPLEFDNSIGCIVSLTGIFE